MELGLKETVVVITGAASGIGRACAVAFAAEGARLGLLDRDDEGLQTTDSRVRELGCAVVTATADVTDEESVRSGINTVAEALGGISVLVGCAGVSGAFGLAPDEISLAEWSRVLEVNVTGAFLVAKHALPYLRRAEQAAIVWIGSDSGVVAAPGMLAYNASKGAIVQFTRALAVDLSGTQIRVNTVCPSIVDTPMARADLGLAEVGFDGVDYPVQTADEVARHVLYLSSAASRPVNGSVLMSDFGFHARSGFPA